MNTLPGTRWRPTRAGLLNVWRFGDETFTFHRGRMLLRGPNGSGKSMALELLFPFLLDADASPFKLTTSPKTRGGLFERVMTGEEGTTRVGCAWAEFRMGADVFTMGVRLRASRSTHRVDADWFTTDLAVGTNLALVDADRVPLVRAALATALGDHGRVHDTAQDYRAAVRTRLFPAFTPAQYDGLIAALLVLRREKISQDLDPAKLSQILTSSLPPLDEKDLSEVAEGFERLDRRRDELARLEDDRTQVEALARRERTYARLIMVREANEVRAAETRRDDVTRAERAAGSALAEETARLEHFCAQADEDEMRSAELASGIEALRNLEAFREGARLESLRREKTRLDDATRRAGDTMRRRESERAAADDQRLRSEQARLEANAGESRAHADLVHLADQLAAAPTVEQACGMPDPNEAEQLLEAWASARSRHVNDVRSALTLLEGSIRDRNLRDQQVEEERQAVARSTARRDEVEETLSTAREEYRAAVREWAGSCLVLDSERLAAKLPVPPDEPLEVLAAVRSVGEEGLAALAAAKALLQEGVGRTQAESAALESERLTLASGRTPEPEPASWRTDRTGRAGAPFWRLVDFHPSCPEGDRGAVEAALLAAGILDAWVSVDGSLALPHAAADAFVGPSGDGAAHPTLGQVLVPVDGTGVPPSIIARLLHRIALADSAVDRSEPAVIARDATFRLATLSGRGRPAPAAFIGATAQERERARRISAIDASLADLARRLAALTREVEDHDRRRRTLDAEVAAAPDGRHVDAAVRELETMVQLVEDAQRRLRDADIRRGDAEVAVRRAQQDLMRLAAQHGLPTDRERLAAQAELLASFARAGGTWARRRRATHRADAELLRCTSEARRAQDELEEARSAADQATRLSREAAAQLAALTANFGAAYEEVVARITSAETEIVTLTARQKAIRSEMSRLERSIGRRERDVAEAARRREEAEARRDESHAGLVAAVGDGLADDAGLPVDADQLASVRGVLDTARSIASRFPTTDAGRPAVSKAHNAVLELVHGALQSLRGRIDLSFEDTGRDWWLLRSAADGVRTRVPQLVARLAQEIELARTELTEEEQRLFDETLTGSVRAAVADRIRQSGTLVDQINRSLGGVRTEAAGVGVRLQWEVDPEQPEATRSVRALLLKDAAAYSDGERAALHRFFRGRIEEVRSDLDGAAGWEERLREVLDYRHWHRFALQIAHRDWQGYEPATTNRLQRLSTGERSIALHLPMLASIAAHYDARPTGGSSLCPRLIVLDELFAGVDKANRAQLFGLMSEWDLDAVFTSDHEWCTYATLDGIAIHHLHAGDDGGLVISSRFVWDGRRRYPAPTDLGPAEPAAGE